MLTFSWKRTGGLRKLLTLTVVSAGIYGMISPQAAIAGTVSGTVYDTDFLKAQPGGFQGIQYPRSVRPNGSDAGQMVYPDNSGNIYRNFNNYALVMDVTTGTVASLQPIPNDPAQVPGSYGFRFPYLPPGPHQLLFIEPYRGEVYKPSTKRLSIVVPPSDDAVVGADIYLQRQWQLTVLATAPAPATPFSAFSSVSADSLDANVSWIAVSTDNGQEEGIDRFGDDIYRTTNGGRTWIKIGRIPAPKYKGRFSPAPQDTGDMTMPERALHFTDALHGTLTVFANSGLVFGNTAPYGYATYVTGDGGATWTSGALLPINSDYGLNRGFVAWDSVNRSGGVFYGTISDFDVQNQPVSVTYTRITRDGGLTWEPGLTRPATDALLSGPARLLTFAGGNYSLFGSGNPGLTTLGGALFPLTGMPEGPLGGPSNNAAYVSGRTAGQSAISLMGSISDGLQHYYRTDDGGATWRHNYWYNGADGYGGSLAHSYSFLSPMVDLLPDGSAWLWSGDDRGDTGRSLDSCLSRTFMGALGTSPFSQSTQTVDASPDIHAGRRAVYQGGNYINGSAGLFAFSFDEEAPTGPASIIPNISFLGYRFNAPPGLYVSLVNAGGDWAKNVTITSVTGTKGARFFTPPLPWNIGAIPPGSTTNQDPNFRDPGEIRFDLDLSSLPVGGTRFSVTVTGIYNNGQTFRFTTYARS